jgi:multiple sugar transport system permease protein
VRREMKTTELQGRRKFSTPFSGRRANAVIALLPFVVFLAIFALYPLYEMIRLSFMRTEVFDGEFLSEFNGLDNFRKIPADPQAINSIKVTLLFSFFCVLFTVVLGIIGAILVQNSRIFKNFARNIFVWPAVVAPVVVSVMWLLILDPTVGLVNKILQSVGSEPQIWLNSKTGAFISVVVVDVWHWTPVVFLFIYAGLNGINQEIIEAARVDGASERQVVRRIILPILLPTIAVITLLRTIMSIKAFDEMYLLTKGGPDGATTLISLHIRKIFVEVLDFGYASALSLCIVASLALIVAVSYFARKKKRAQK